MIKHFRGSSAFSSPLPFSPAVRAGEFVFISGMASADAQGKIIPDTFENEARRTYENIRRVLAAMGLMFADVVQVRCYLAKQKDWEAHNRIYREFFQAPFPARTTLIGCLGNIVKYEVEVVAYVGKRKTKSARKTRSRKARK